MLGTFLISSTAAPTALTVGVVLPAHDPALDGVRLGAAEAARAADLIGATFTFHEAHALSPADVRDAAARLIAEHRAVALIGGADAAAASVLMDVADEHGVLFLNVGAADDSLRLRCSALSFHVTPAASMLREAGAVVARSDAGPAAWHNTLTRYGAAQVNARFRAMFDRPIGERAWAGWFAVKAAWESALRSSPDAVAMARHLTSADVVLDGHKGVPLSFHTDTHQLRQPLYLVAGDSVIAEAPSPRDTSALDHAALLDRIGVADGGETCAT